MHNELPSIAALKPIEITTACEQIEELTHLFIAIIRDDKNLGASNIALHLDVDIRPQCDVQTKLMWSWITPFRERFAGTTKRAVIVPFIWMECRRSHLRLQ